MDVQPTQPISDDQQLAKVLAGISEEAEANQAATTPVVTDTTTTGTTPADGSPAPLPAPLDAAAPSVPAAPVALADVPVPFVDTPNLTPAPSTPPATDGSLESVKKDALNELRPLVDKLDLSPEEKFDTYLLLIRSTDDQSLIAPAHAAAATITDEAKKAQALLDIIKEIDYFSQPK